MADVAEATENQWPWRVGRKVGRTIYVQLGTEPSDADPLIGVMDSEEIARDAVVGHNERGRHRFGAPHRFSSLGDLCTHDIWPNGSIDNPCHKHADHPIHREPSPWSIRPYYDGRGGSMSTDGEGTNDGR